MTTPAPTTIPTELVGAYTHCADVTRQRARNFYYGLRLTPEPKRSAIYSVYAWMRQADDEADAAGAPQDKLRRIAALRVTTEAMIEGRSLPELESEPIWRAFAHTSRSFGLDSADLHGLLDGLEFDLERECQARERRGTAPAMMCRSREDLREYCYRVASTVGLVCIQIWGLQPGVDRAEARRLAVMRGLAFQLTNILRDFAQDYDDGRIYLAEEDFRRHEITPSALRRWEAHRASEGMVRELAEWAREAYDSSEALDGMIDPACAAALSTMTRIYSGLLGVVERDPRRVVGTERIRLQSFQKAGIAVRAVLRSWIGQRTAVASQ